MPVIGISWAAAAAISTVTSAAVTGYSVYSSAQQQSANAANNALIARQNASLTAKQMEITKKEKGIIESRYRQQAEKTLAAQRAGWAKTGVTMEGTPLLVAAESMTEADIDALAIRYAGTVEQSQLLSQQAGYKQQETLEKMKGKMYNQAGYLGAGSSLLTGVSNFGSIVGNKDFKWGA